jgi:hypothetical protein
MPDILLVTLYAVVLMVPGGLLAALAGLRGWTLAAMAPLLTYTVAGLAGPWSESLGIRWSFLAFLGWWTVFAVVVFAVRWFSGTVTPLPRLWLWRAQAGVLACMAAATFVSVFVVVKGMGGLSVVPQDWDAVWHANSVRWIADTGEGGLYAPGQLNWYESSAGMYYPNGYHLLGALVYSISGNSVVEVLNAHTIFIPAMVALSVVAVVRRFGGRAVVAGLSALLIVSTAAFYDNLWRGPLLPFETGLALTPLAVVMVADLLDTGGPWRVRSRPAFVLAIGMAGLVCVHSSTAFGLAVFVLPMLLMRWVREPKRIPREVGTLVVAGLVVGLLASVQLLGMLGSGQGVSDVDWPASQARRPALARRGGRRLRAVVRRRGRLRYLVVAEPDQAVVERPVAAHRVDRDPAVCARRARTRQRAADAHQHRGPGGHGRQDRRLRGAGQDRAARRTGAQRPR